MKPFADLTDAELASPDLELSRYVDLQCADEGIPLVPERAPMPPTNEDIQEDQTAYTILVNFPSREDADLVAEFARKFPRVKGEYAHGIPGYKEQWIPLQTGEAIDITTSKKFSRDRLAKMGAAIVANEGAKKQYDEDKRAYDRIVESRRTIVERFAIAVRAAQAREYARTTARRTFARYLELAEGNRRTACRFMVNAQPDAAQLLPEMFEPDEQGPIPTIGTRGYNIEPAVPEEELL
jgi:hypothetical protein